MNPIAEYRIRNDLAETHQAGAWLEKLAAEAGLSSTARNAFDLSLAEWLTNIVSYAYEDSLEHWIAVRFAVSGPDVQAEIEDDGREFNPLLRPPVDTSASLETRPIGGLGIHMMRQLMDRVEYRRTAEGRNVLTLTRRKV